MALAYGPGRSIRPGTGDLATDRRGLRCGSSPARWEEEMREGDDPPYRG